MSQKFLFKWNNHMKVMNEFKNFLSLGIMVDVTLACDGKSLKAHKIVLSACSSFFRSLFIENPCKHPIVILKDIRYTELQAIIDFMYCGEVDIAENQVSALLKAAQTLRVKGLGEVESLDDRSGYESQNPSGDEFEYPSTKNSENHSDSETVISSSDVQKQAFRQKQSVTEQNDNGDSAMENITIKQELQRKSFESPPQLNKELTQNHSDNSSSLVSGISAHETSDTVVTNNQQPETSSGTSTHESSDTVIIDNQQPSTSSASGKRPSKKTVHQPLKKKVKLIKNSSQKSVRQPLKKKVKLIKNSSRKSVGQRRNLRKPEVIVISDSNMTKKLDKIEDSKNTTKRANSKKSEDLNKIEDSKSITKKSTNNKKNEDLGKIEDSKSTTESTSNKQSKVKLYECEICPFKTICRKSLKIHINSRHPEKKRFKCGQCAYVAYGKYKFERHIAVHQIERPYHCSLCAYKFRRSVDLKKHVKIVHKLERLIFKCKECDFSAAEQGCIKKHRIAVHEKIPTVIIAKLPDIIEKSPDVIEKLPEVIEKSPEVIEKSPEVIKKLPEEV